VTVDDPATQQPAQRSALRRRAGVIGRWIGRCLARWRPILLAMLLVATTGFGAAYFSTAYRPDLQTDDTVAHQAVKAASDGAVALLSYSPDTLSRDFDNAKSRLTDNYLAYYRGFADQIVGPAAQHGRITTTATVVKAGIVELHPNSAVVLVFLKQKTASKEKPVPVISSSSIRVTLNKVDNAWLIDKFDTV
jgi:Mce-associated membrane protein